VTYDSRPETYQHIEWVRLLMMRAVFDLLVRESPSAWRWQEMSS
jgi:hypothetical protein